MDKIIKNNANECLSKDIENCLKIKSNIIAQDYTTFDKWVG